jgi:hypothetical protein
VYRFSSQTGPDFLGAIPRMSLWLALFGLPVFVLGWGGGHDPLNELAVETMPPSLRATFTGESAKAIVKYSHAPDDFTPWEKQTKVTIHPDDLAVLHAHGLKHPYSLHSPTGQAVDFILLVKAFKAKDPARAAYWSACLLHTFADEGACNHDPLLHFTTYAFTQGYHMQLGKQGVLDFAQVARTKADHDAVRALLAGFTPSPLAKEANEALVQVMLHGLQANEYMTQRGPLIARTFATEASADDIKAGRQALAELGVYGIKSGLDAIWTAWQLAREGLVPELTPAVEQDYRKRAKEFLAKRPLSSDAIYQGLLSPKADGPAVGVLVETSQSMNRAWLSFSSKYLGSAIMRALLDAGIAYRPVDVRTVDRSGLPMPADMPAVILCPGSFSHKPMVAALRAYAAQGGRILLVGGEHRGILAELSQCLGKPEGARLPVSPKYGQNNTDYIDELRVCFVGGLEKQLGTEPRAFIHNPDTKAGWQKPRCDYALVKPSPNVRALATLRDGARTFGIAGVLVDEKGSVRHAFVPEYLVSPYLLTDSPPLTDPSRPTLDDVGRTVILHVVRGMLP